MESIWMDTVNIKHRPCLSGDIKTEAAVIGAGMAGILTAHFLSNFGIDAVILEADRIAGGQTKNTTAKITYQHDLIYTHLLKKFGPERSRQYLYANRDALEQYLSIIESEQISCHLKTVPSYLYTKKDTKPLRTEAMALLEIDNMKTEITKDTTLPFPVKGALRFDHQAMFHPLEFISHISKPLNIYEQTPVLSVQDHVLHTPCGTVTADHIVFTTHFPFVNAPGYYFLRMHQERSYVLALKHAQEVDGMYLGIDENGYSFRNFEDLLLFGGSGHRTGENTSGHKYESLEVQALKYWPDYEEVTRWSAQDCMTADHVPYIGPYSASTPDWYVATGFRKWGMTGSMTAALVLSHLIAKRDYPYGGIFSPQRLTFFASAKSIAFDSGHAIKNLAKDLGHSEDALPRCPHLGCRLSWNPDEKTFDCPCHGSRFSREGKLIDNPAIEDLHLTHSDNK